MLVLAYHRIQVDPTDTLSVSTRAFRRQLRLLMALGWQATDLGSIESRARQFAVTFDDGYRDNLTYAAPILRSLRVPATFFVTSGFVDDDKLYSWRVKRMAADDADGLPLRLQDLLELGTLGFRIGAHSVTHPHLPMLTDAELKAEVCGSKEAIEALCKRPCRYFAYPFGHIDARVVRAIEEAGYEDAFITPPHPRIPNRRFTRHRVGVYRHDSLLRFGLKVSAPYGRILRPLIWALRARDGNRMFQ